MHTLARKRAPNRQAEFSDSETGLQIRRPMWRESEFLRRRRALAPLAPEIERFRSFTTTGAYVTGSGGGYSFADVPIRSASERAEKHARDSANQIRHDQGSVSTSAQRESALALVDKLDHESRMVGAPEPARQQLHHHYSLTARIERSESGSRSAGAGQYDSPSAEPVRAEPTFEETPLKTEGLDIPEPAEGQTVHLPDIVPPGTEAIEQADSVVGVLTYNPLITRGGPAPSGFGATRPYTHGLSSITVTPLPHNYLVTATVDNPIEYQVRASTGPAGQLDIESEDDSDITAANYETVASDLMPDMSDLNGRPPRTAFWARDLTIKHERFHAIEDAVWGAVGTAQAVEWLNGETASSVFHVYMLLAQVPMRVATKVSTEMGFPGRENRAYGDGAPDYEVRSALISSKGWLGGYP
jgi:hypothetical protein